jgi:large subunit ribosomal protein L19
MKCSNYIQHFEQKQNQPTYTFQIGEYIKVGFWDTTQKKRVQFFEGIVISIKHSGSHQKMVTIRRPGSSGIERVFASNSPQIQTVARASRGFPKGNPSLREGNPRKFRRSKLFYLRKRIGKAAFG